MRLCSLALVAKSRSALQLPQHLSSRKAEWRCTRHVGFTLIETAIVLVILGLLAGVFLVGQELIGNARKQFFIQKMDKINVAYLAFIDRFRDPPGDYARASVNIRGLGAICTSSAGNGNGNGNGVIEFASQPHENLLVWEHLSKAGIIDGEYVCDTTPGPKTSPANSYGSWFNLQFDASYQGSNGTASRHNLSTGHQVPSNILAAIDRSIDDGNPNTGRFRAPDFPNPSCYSGIAWSIDGTNCQGLSLY